MDTELSIRVIEALKSRIDLLRDKRVEIVSRVGDLAEAEGLSIYQEVMEQIDQTEELIEEIENEDLILIVE